uniref:Movement protein TGB2 n=1 Tax=papaya mottle-associated virus TaxID=3071214 RepID=A0A6G7S6Z5_9VIRU|nr:Triple gene block protein 2 [papaya mottle-associated virus]
MPLTAPIDHTRTYISVVIGCCLAALTHFATRHTDPVAGDSQHRFPFGGCYKDGNKAATYFPKRDFLPSSRLIFGRIEIFGIITVLVLLILLSNKRGTNRCERCHASHH